MVEAGYLWDVHFQLSQWPIQLHLKSHLYFCLQWLHSPTSPSDSLYSSAHPAKIQPYLLLLLLHNYHLTSRSPHFNHHILLFVPLNHTLLCQLHPATLLNSIRTNLNSRDPRFIPGSYPVRASLWWNGNYLDPCDPFNIPYIAAGSKIRRLSKEKTTFKNILR